MIKLLQSNNSKKTTCLVCMVLCFSYVWWKAIWSRFDKSYQLSWCCSKKE